MVIELILADDYILGIKDGLGHALYDYTRQIDEILDSAYSGRLTIDPVKKSLLNDFNISLKRISDEIYSNPQFDLESMSKALSSSMTLVSSGQLSLAGLSTNFDKVLSKDNMTSWPKLLEKARNLQTSSSSQYDSKPLYPSKSSRLNAMGASNDNVASGSYWRLAYGDVAGRLFSDRLFTTDDYGDAVDTSERIVQVVSSWKEDANLTKAQEEVRSEILARLFEGYLYDKTSARS